MKPGVDTCVRPPEGWSDPDERGHIRFTMYDRLTQPSPEREGYKAYFVAVHGMNFTRWTYAPEGTVKP